MKNFKILRTGIVRKQILQQEQWLKDEASLWWNPCPAKWKVLRDGWCGSGEMGTSHIADTGRTDTILLKGRLAHTPWSHRVVLGRWLDQPNKKSGKINSRAMRSLRRKPHSGQTSLKVKFSFIPAPTSVERDGCKDLVHNSTKTGNECARSKHEQGPREEKPFSPCPVWVQNDQKLQRKKWNHRSTRRKCRVLRLNEHHILV